MTREGQTGGDGSERRFRCGDRTYDRCQCGGIGQKRGEPIGKGGYQWGEQWIALIRRDVSHSEDIFGDVP